MLARARCFTALSLVSVLAGCSADSVTPPPPAVERPGSFVAATDADGVIVLMRTLRVVPIDSAESLYDAILYEGVPSSYDEAKTWAQDRDWPVADPHTGFSLRTIMNADPEVVWFRTLTEDEYAALLD